MAKLCILTLTLAEAKALLYHLPHPTSSIVTSLDYQDAHRKLNNAVVRADKPEVRKV